MQAPSAASARSARARRASDPTRAARRRRRIKGCTEPRIFTPPLRELTEETTLGFMAIRFARDVCKVELYPWQEWLLIHALELAPGLTVETMHQREHLDPLFRFRKIVILVARQNGKSTLSQILSLFFMYVLGVRLTLGTAQDLDTAEEVWEGAWEIIDETPELRELADKPVLINGKKAIRLTTGERYKVKAANRRAGRGLSGDLIMLDELREHQTWDAWAAITKTTMARPSALIFALSNAGDASSVVLRHLRLSAHRQLGDPDGIVAAANPDALLPTDDELDDEWVGNEMAEMVASDLEADEDESTIGLFEWSAHPDRDVMDRDGWAEANPSLGYGISEATLAGDAVDDSEWVFRTECLCQWSEGSLSGIFPAGKWISTQDATSSLADDARRVACVVVNHERSRAHVGLAGARPDGKLHVGIVASRAGTDWIKGWLKEDPRAARIDTVVLQERGAPESSLAEELSGIKRRDDAGRLRKLAVLPWGGSELAKAHGSFFDLVRDEKIGHRPQPVLDVAEAVAVPKAMGDAWVIDLQKSAADASPLKACVGAAWGLTSSEPPRRSAYADADAELVVI